MAPRRLRDRALRLITVYRADCGASALVFSGVRADIRCVIQNAATLGAPLARPISFRDAAGIGQMGIGGCLNVLIRRDANKSFFICNVRGNVTAGARAKVQRRQSDSRYSRVDRGKSRREPAESPKSSQMEDQGSPYSESRAASQAGDAPGHGLLLVFPEVLRASRVFPVSSKGAPTKLLSEQANSSR